MGWLHWTEEQLVFSDINSVMVGHTGMQDMLGAIFGKPDPPPPPPEPVPPEPVIVNLAPDKLPKLTPAAFDKMFANVKGKPN